MPYDVTNNQTGVVITFDKEPTQKDIDEAFASTTEQPKISAEPTLWGKLNQRGENMLTPDPTPMPFPFNVLGQLTHVAGETGGAANDIFSSAIGVAKNLIPQPVRDAYSKGSSYLADLTGSRKIDNALASGIDYAQKEAPIASRYITDLANATTGLGTGKLLTEGASAMVKPVRNFAKNTSEFLYRKQLKPSEFSNVKDMKDLASQDALAEYGISKGYTLAGGGEKKFLADKSLVTREKYNVLANAEDKTVKFDDMMQDVYKLAENPGLKAGARPITGQKSLNTTIEQLKAYWLLRYPDGNVPLAHSQMFKEALHSRIGDTGFSEIKKALSVEAEKALASGTRKAIETAVPELGAVNRKLMPLLDFENTYAPSLAHVKDAPLSWTGTVFNNPTLMNALAKGLNKVGTAPKDYPWLPANYGKTGPIPYGNDEGGIPTAPYKDQPQIGYVRQMPDTGSIPDKYSGYVPPLTQPTQKAIGYDPNIHWLPDLADGSLTQGSIPPELMRYLSINAQYGKPSTIIKKRP